MNERKKRINVLIRPFDNPDKKSVRIRRAGKWLVRAVLFVVLSLGILRLAKRAGYFRCVPTMQIAMIKTPTSTPRSANMDLPATIINNGHEMALVPAGSFEMGSTNGDPDECPIYSVHLDDFYIDLYEVTNGQFAEFLNEQGNQEEEGVTWLDASDTDVHIQQIDGIWRALNGYDNHPVVEVTWYGANAYCDEQDARLPTEAEWEKAARGTDERTYPWGKKIDNTKANYQFANSGTAEVGSYPDGVNSYGLYDMAGNVLEWVSDWYAFRYYRTLTDGVQNPPGPASGTNRVLRGGSWRDVDYYIRSSYRYGNIPSLSTFDYGFRCARSP